MKRLLIIAALIAGTAIYVFTAAWAYEHMDLYLKPASKTEVTGHLSGGRVAEDNMSMYRSPEVTLNKELYDKNVGTSLTSAYYYAFGVKIQSLKEI